MTDQSAGYVPLAAVERNGFDEGVHFGRVIALDADGSEALALGDVDAPMHPRSANKLHAGCRDARAWPCPRR